MTKREDVMTSRVEIDDRDGLPVDAAQRAAVEDQLLRAADSEIIPYRHDDNGFVLTSQGRWVPRDYAVTVSWRGFLLALKKRLELKLLTDAPTGRSLH